MDLRELLHQDYPVSDSTVDLFRKKCTPYTLRKGECAITQGAVSHHAYFIFDGYFRLCNCAEDGREDTICFGSGGDFVVSLHSLQHDMPSVFSLEAITDCHGLRISLRNFREIIESNEEMLRWIARFAVDQIFFFEKRYMLMRNPDATARYMEFLRIQKDRALNIPIKFVAQYIGVTSETLSRIRARIRKQL